MKIAYLCQTYPPMLTGVSLALERLAEGMHERGHTILVVVASESGEHKEEEKERFRLVRLHSFNNPMAAKQRFMAWPRSKIGEELNHFAPDIFHIHDPLLAGLAGVSLGKERDIPVVLTLHLQPKAVSVHFPGVPGLRRSIEAITREYGKRILKQCAAVVAPSETIAELIREHVGVEPQVISNGVDLETFSPIAEAHEEEVLQEKLKLASDIPIILYVGRLSREKEIGRILHLAARALEQVKAHLVVVGDGPQKEELIELSEELGIREHCRFPGFIPPEAGLPAVYRMARVFMMTSEIEAQGKTTLEALASGTPVLAVQSPATAELVQDGVTGYLVDTNDEETLAKRLLSLLTDSEAAGKMGQAGRAFAVAEHSYENSLGAHAELYETLTAGAIQ